MVDSGDLFTGEVITRSMKAWMFPIKFASGETVK